MKQFIYENGDAIKKRKQYTTELIESLNTVLSRFRARHNHFSQPIDETFAFTLLMDPLGTFDDLLKANSPVKPIAAMPLNIERLAELTGIDRTGFIADFTLTLPGTMNVYARKGQQGLIKLTTANRSLVTWAKDHFTLNEQALAAELEAHRVYASEPDQLAELDYWNGLAAKLNTLVDRKILDTIDCNLFSSRIRMIVFLNGRFVPDYKALASKIKAMILVN